MKYHLNMTMDLYKYCNFNFNRRKINLNLFINSIKKNLTKTKFN